MASLLRTLARPCSRALASKNFIKTVNLQPRCLISTSKKNKESATATLAPEEKAESKPRESTEDLENADLKDENWISFGYDYVDRDMDNWYNSIAFFFTIVVGMFGTGFVLTYMPDHRFADWSIREAYLELDRRERAGLPLIDKNLIPPEKVQLPTDEELGKTDVII